MPEEKVLSRGEAKASPEPTPAEVRKIKLDAKMDAILNQQKAVLEVAGPLGPAGQAYWDIYAVGPSQRLDLAPSRVINVGEEATIDIYVVLNESYPEEYSACQMLTEHNDKIEIFIFTSNMQTMEPADDLQHTECIFLQKGVCQYHFSWTFKPTKAACLYEMNICARVCNCSNEALPEFSGFVWWVQNLDTDWWNTHGKWTFDHPIRFMVSDPAKKCECVQP